MKALLLVGGPHPGSHRIEHAGITVACLCHHRDGGRYVWRSVTQHTEPPIWTYTWDQDEGSTVQQGLPWD